jgi:hypothetical protein
MPFIEAIAWTRSALRSGHVAAARCLLEAARSLAATDAERREAHDVANEVQHAVFEQYDSQTVGQRS